MNLNNPSHLNSYCYWIDWLNIHKIRKNFNNYLIGDIISLLLLFLKEEQEEI